MKEQVSLVLLCAGDSVRFRGESYIPKKQWLHIDGSPLWKHVLGKFQTFNFAKVILTFASSEVFYAKKFIEDSNTICISGGDTRQKSLQNALEYITTPFVLVSDVARAGVTVELIAKLLEHVKTSQVWDCIVPTLPISDTVALRNEENLNYLKRENIHLIQTPQLSKTNLLKTALKNGEFTDESSAINAIGGEVYFIEGQESAHKITHLQDFYKVFKNTQQQIPQLRIGNGFDVHKYCNGEGFKICGVLIPCGFSVIAHSDGDVALHALSDALLGSLGAGDIGHWFPDTDEKFKGADSSVLLEQIISFCYGVGYKVAQLDLTIIAQLPKISPHIEKMEEHLVTLFHIAKSQINIKATTTERLGFIGREEGIAAYASVVISPIIL